MKISFEELKKECKECAADFITELELLPIFLNYYKDVEDKWLEEAGLKKGEISKIKKVVDEYAKRKVELEKKEKPQNREETIKIEDKVLREMYEGIVVKVGSIKDEFIKSFLQSKYPDAVILSPEQMHKLEKVTLFVEHMKKFPADFLVFDAESNKIIGYELFESSQR
jgi:hypothetical protein